MARLYESDLIALERELIAGNQTHVSLKLLDVKLEDISRSVVYKVANLLSRSGHSREAVKLLRPLVVLRKSMNLRPSDAEYLEYALALSLIGAHREALERFDRYKGLRDFKFNFYYSAALITQWRYAEAIPHLKEVIQAKEAPDYQKSVAKTNLAGALIFVNDFGPAEDLVNELIQSSVQKKQKLIQGHCAELAAQIHFFRQDYDGALKLLKEGEKLLVTAPQSYLITNKKWQILSRYGRDPKSSETKSAVTELRAQAIKTEFWETVRECDLQTAIISRNENLFQKVYFGTPYPSYRKKILQRYGKSISIPEHYDWSPAPSDGSLVKVFNLSKGIEVGGTEALLNQKVLYSLLCYLASDFYQPFRVESLFSNLFAGQYYDPQSSDSRVYATINRLRNWLKEQKIPIVIRRRDYGYRLFFLKPYTLRVGRREEGLAKKSVLDLILELPNIKDGVGIGEITDKLQVSRASAQRRVAEYVSEGKLEKTGNGRSTTYFAIKK